MYFEKYKPVFKQKSCAHSIRLKQLIDTRFHIKISHRVSFKNTIYIAAGVYGSIVSANIRYYLCTRRH